MARYSLSGLVFLQLARLPLSVLDSALWLAQFLWFYFHSVVEARLLNVGFYGRLAR